MKRVIVATVGLAFLTALVGPAFAQPADENDPMVLDQKEKKKELEEIDKRYKATLQKTRKDGPSERIDPWANMRSGGNANAKR